MMATTSRPNPASLDRWEHDLYDQPPDEIPDRGDRGGARGIRKGYRGGPGGLGRRPSNPEGRFVIEHLHWKVTEADLKELFQEFGIKEVRLRFDATDRSTGIADLKFESDEQGAAASAKFNGMLLDDQAMQIRAWDQDKDGGYRDPRNGPRSKDDMFFMSTSRTVGNREEGFRTTASLAPRTGRARGNFGGSDSRNNFRDSRGPGRGDSGSYYDGRRSFGRDTWRDRPQRRFGEDMEEGEELSFQRRPDWVRREGISFRDGGGRDRRYQGGDRDRLDRDRERTRGDERTSFRRSSDRDRDRGSSGRHTDYDRGSDRRSGGRAQHDGSRRDADTSRLEREMDEYMRSRMEDPGEDRMEE